MGQDFTAKLNEKGRKLPAFGYLPITCPTE
jgi:hypothetical protein